MYMRIINVECLGVKENASSPVCIFRTKVCPMQKDKTYLKKPTYDVWFIIDNPDGEVKLAYCECCVFIWLALPTLCSISCACISEMV